MRIGIAWLLCGGMIGSGVYAAPAPALLKPVKPVVACASLAQASLDAAVDARVKIDSAVAGEVDASMYCEIKGTIAPKINFELRMPVSGWSGRYLQVGCGGLCGVLNIRVEHAEDCRPLSEHSVALASTDMGHSGATMGDGSFGKDPQARIDFAYRGVHLTALAAKALILAYYGQPAKYAYFSGCSDGGREALMEAQRFPEDFDGISAGAPAMNFQVQNTFYHAWMYAANHRPDGTAIITVQRLPVLHAAALASCDAVDGLKDGQITDPRACHFDPAQFVCKANASGSDCLSAAEASAAIKLYQGPRDAAGHQFTVGGPQVGSELSWAGVFIPDSPHGAVMSEGAALDTLRYLAFETNPAAGYSLKDFHFDQAGFQRLEALHPLYDATDTDLSKFQARGGKLLMWHGWSDPHISPLNSIAYYQAVRSQLGAAKTDSFLRLFLFPGMYHCGGGDGTGSFDALTPLMAWVEGGASPERIIAGHADMPFGMGPPPGMKPGAGGPPPNLPPLRITRTRPVFAYPQVAMYRGSGSPDDAASFIAAAPAAPERTAYEWEGARFMAPDFHKSCHVADGKLACQ